MNYLEVGVHADSEGAHNQRIKPTPGLSLGFASLSYLW
jgi:hypothetical protein